MRRPVNVVYLLLYFPRLTETFVAEEMKAIRRHDVNVSIVSLLKPARGPVQPLSQKLEQYKWCPPSPWNWRLWGAHLYYLSRSTHLYFTLLFTLLRQPYAHQRLRGSVKRLATFMKAVAVAYHLKGSGTDLLHSHFAWLSAAATWICARLLGLPFTVTVHAYDLYSPKNDLLCLITREADHVIAISEFNRQYLESVVLCPASKISVVHCGVETATLNRRLRSASSCNDGQQLRIVSVGSLVHKKGHHILVDACHLLKERGFEFVCTIIGGGPELRALKRRINTRGLGEHVRLSGALSQPYIRQAYQEHDVFVLACVVAPNGDRDGIPVALMEAGDNCLPLVSTTVSGISELVRHNDTGILVEPDDPRALADALEMLARDPALREKLGQSACTLVNAEFNIARTSSQLANVFRKIRQNAAAGV